MTNEERDLITRFVERAGGAAVAPDAGGQAVQPALPPIDREADALLAELFGRYPEARYRITQMAFVQEHALVEAQNRINRLQWELQQAHQPQAAPQQPAGSPWGAAGGGVAGAAAAAQPQQPRGFFSSLFGGGGPTHAAAPSAPQYAQPPQPQYPPNYNPGMFQQQGSGFLGSALRTAAGVAGGVVAADALMGLFSGHHEGGFGGGGFGGAPQQMDYAPGEQSSPWGAPPPGVDPYDVGGAPKDPVEGNTFSGPADVDQSAWQPAPDQGGGDSGGWQDAPAQDSGDQDPGDQGGGWDDQGGGGDDFQNT